MLTVHEVSEMSGVSIRTLQYYDTIGLLKPEARTESGYRLYGEDNLARLQQILLFRELEFTLREIGEIIDSPGFDRELALDQQITLLEFKRERLEKLIELAKNLKDGGMKTMSFDAFDTDEMDRFAQEAKASWGDTREWAEYEKKSAGRSKHEEAALGNELLALFVPFGRMAADGCDPASDEARAQARCIQEFISKNYYQCSDEVFAQFGRAYGSGGDFTRNINASAGEGAAEFAARTIDAMGLLHTA